MKPLCVSLILFFLYPVHYVFASDSESFLKAQERIKELKGAGTKIDPEIAQELLAPIAREFMTDDQRAFEFGMTMNLAGVDNRLKRRLTSWFYLEVANQKRIRYIEEHPELEERIKTAIRFGDLIIGMTEEQAILVWGRPIRTNRTVTRGGVREQWVYGSSGPFVYFENGRLTAWQD